MVQERPALTGNLVRGPAMEVVPGETRKLETSWSVRRGWYRDRPRTHYDWGIITVDAVCSILLPQIVDILPHSLAEDVRPIDIGEPAHIPW